MASLVLAGDTSGSITVSAPAVAGSNTQTLVAATDTLAPIIRGTALTAVTNFTTSADFTNIPSWAKRITVMFNAVSLTGSDSILVQIGSGSLSTSGYTSGSSSGASGVGTATSTSGFIVRTTASGDTLYGSMVIQNITSNTWVANHTFGGAVFFIGGGISPNLSGALNLVSVTRSGTNTFDTGTINLLWE